MNKLLIGTAAAALFVSPAVAGPMAVTVGGYYNAVVYSQDVDGTEKRDLAFTMTMKLFSKVKAKPKTAWKSVFKSSLKAEGSGEKDHIDENYIYVKGDFGKVEIGAENNAAYKQQVSAPKFSVGKLTITILKHGPKFLTLINLMDGVDGDALKINYYSPKINGFQFSYSLTPDTSNTAGDTGLYNDSGSGDDASAYKRH